MKNACLQAAAAAASSGSTSSSSKLAVTCVVADVANEKGWKAIREALLGGGTIKTTPDTAPSLDLLVLNAGLSMGSSFEALAAGGEAMPVMKTLMDVNYVSDHDDDDDGQTRCELSKKW